MPVLPELRHGRFWVVFGWVAVVAALIVCTLPARYVEVPNVSDKVEHTLGYVLLTLWFCGIYPRRRYVWIVLGFVLFGAAIEVLQSAMNLGRHGDLNDMVADVAGIGIGLLLAFTPLGRWPHGIERFVDRR